MALGALACVLAVLGVPLPVAHADSSVGDGSPESCTEAALNAALLAGGTIRFRCGPAPKVIVLTTFKSITIDTTLEGDGLILLSGDDKTAIFVVTKDRSLTLRAITLTNADSGIADGGAIHNAGGHVSLVGSTIQQSRTASWGGALASRGGTIALENSVIRGNRATRAALYISGTLTAISSTIASNVSAESGGGIYLDAGVADIRESSIRDNSTETGDGGGVFVAPSGMLTVIGGDISRNIAAAENRSGGGVATSGRTSLAGVTVDENFGYAAGGIWNHGGNAEIIQGSIVNNRANAAAGLLTEDGSTALIEVTIDSNQAMLAGGGVANYGGSTTITASTVSNNRAGGDTISGGGGGILSQLGEVTLTNSTVSGNVAGSGGGILSLGGTTTLGNVTVADNSGGADGVDIYRNDGLVVIRNTIVAGRLPQLNGSTAPSSKFRPNTSRNPTQSSNCFGIITSLGYNLSDDESCGLNAGGDQEDSPAQLDPLADNDGGTLTHMLRADSPARDTGAPTGCPAFDQRGVERPFGSACDKGSVEYDVAATPTATVTPTTGEPTASPSPTRTPGTPPTIATVTGTPTSATATPTSSGEPSTATSTPTQSGSERTPGPSVTVSPGPEPVWLFLPALRTGVR